MWFKNLLLYRLTDPANLDLSKLEEQLQKRAFVPVGQMDRQSEGWVPPASHAPDLFSYPNSGAWLVALKTEEKLLPASVVKELADERIVDIEAKEMRRVGKKEAKEIRERIAEELLPRAFSRSRVVRALIDPQAGWIWIDVATPARAELLLQTLRETLGSLPAKLAQTRMEPTTAMTTWLEHDAPANFTIDADCVLTAPGDGGAQVSCRRQDLNADEVKQHLTSGKLVTQLALSWDERLSFVLTDKMQIKRLAFLDLLEDQIKDADATDAAAMFDTSLTLLVNEGRSLVAAVIEALDGEMDTAAGVPALAAAPAMSQPVAKPTVSADQAASGQSAVDVPW